MQFRITEWGVRGGGGGGINYVCLWPNINAYLHVFSAYNIKKDDKLKYMHYHHIIENKNNDAGSIPVFSSQ